jgi:hypothetical protein
MNSLDRPLFLVSSSMLRPSQEKRLNLSFINVNTLEETKSRELRRLVSHHVGKYHRNRSKPARKAETRRDDSQVPPFVQAYSSACSNVEQQAARHMSEASQRDQSVTMGADLFSRRQSIEVMSRQMEVMNLKKTKMTPHLTHTEDSAVVQTHGACFQQLRTVQTQRPDEYQAESRGREGTLVPLWKWKTLSIFNQNASDPFTTEAVDNSQVSALLDHGTFISLRLVSWLISSVSRPALLVAPVTQPPLRVSQHGQCCLSGTHAIITNGILFVYARHIHKF